MDAARGARCGGSCECNHTEGPQLPRGEAREGPVQTADALLKPLAARPAPEPINKARDPLVCCCKLWRVSGARCSAVGAPTLTLCLRRAGAALLLGAFSRAPRAS
jgi:hypothetical protein